MHIVCHMKKRNKEVSWQAKMHVQLGTQRVPLNSHTKVFTTCFYLTLEKPKSTLISPF